MKRKDEAAGAADAEALCSTYEASLLLACGCDAVRAMVRRGDLAVGLATRAGRLYRRSDVIALAEARRVQALAAAKRRSAQLAATQATKERRALAEDRAARKAHSSALGAE